MTIRMNERILELARQIDWSTDTTNGELTKFAELIVQDCLVQISEAIPDTNCSASGVYNTAKLAATSRVKEHFGVR